MTHEVAHNIMVACAGWNVPRTTAGFPQEGSQLERYGSVLPAVEINTSFYRPHRPATYARWRDSVPDAFRFCVKMPKEISHVRRLHDCEDVLAAFLGEAGELGAKLGCLLLQLPPSLAFDARAAHGFLRLLRQHTDVDAVCEPRHASWSGEEAGALLRQFRVACVQADPAVVPLPQGHDTPVYLRLHGSPRIYYSEYSLDYIAAVAQRLTAARAAGRRAWCVFDNTAAGAALPNALTLLERLTPAMPGQ